MSARDLLRRLADSGPLFRETAARGNVAVLRSLLGPAWRGLVLTRKLERLYEINDNLYVIMDALMTDSR